MCVYIYIERERERVVYQTAISKTHGNCKPKIDHRYTYKKKKKESKHNTKYSHQIAREQKRKRKENYKNKYKTINPMAIRTFLSIITLNVNVLTAPTERHRLAERIQNRPTYMLSTRDPLQI